MRTDISEDSIIRGLTTRSTQLCALMVNNGEPPNALLDDIILCRNSQLDPLFTSVTEAVAHNIRLIT